MATSTNFLNFTVLSGGDRAGYTISLNDAGNAIVFGAPTHATSFGGAGKVELYTFDGSFWVSAGSLTGDFANHRLGQSVSINDDGTIFAVGTNQAVVDGATFTGGGEVRVYEYKNGEISQLGTDIFGGQAGDSLFTQSRMYGYAVDISDDGTRVAIGNPRDSFQRSDTSTYKKYEGSAEVWEYRGSDWVQVGTDLIPSITDLNMPEKGTSVSLTGDGTTVAVGGGRGGIVEVYKENAGVWSLVGSPIRETGTQFGGSISISDSGDVLAIGAKIDNKTYW